jgi:tetratricopeptide (TPR) repeat protein
MTDTRLVEAAQLRRENQFDRAASLCFAVLEDAPDNAEAMSLLGICFGESGDVISAGTWLDKAEAADPTLGVTQLYRSIMHEMADDPASALAAARRASELSPDRFDVWGRYGDLAGRSGAFAESAEAFGRALAVDAAHPARGPVALRLAAARMEAGEAGRVAEALDAAAAAGHGQDPDFLRMRAALARQEADWVGMAEFARNWMRAAPQDHEANSALALSLSQQGYYKGATEAFRPVVKGDPSAVNLAALGRLVLGSRDIGQAKSYFDQALAIDAHCGEAAFGMARVHTILGQIPEAEAYCRRCLDIDPANLEAFGLLCEVTSGRISDSEIVALAQALENTSLPVDQRAIGLFALGDAHHRRKNVEKAFSTWQRANDHKKLQHNGAVVSGYDRAEQERRTQFMIDAFPSDIEGRPGSSASDDGITPIFIVGMPRSGTTLIEAAIAAHEDVNAGGELSALPFILEEFMAWAAASGWTGGPIDAEKLAVWRQRYLGQYKEFGLEGARWVTDKQPSNFLSVGLIRQLFPAAPIIHIRRQPIETAFSIFRRNFSRQWPFAHDLDDIAHYYAEQARLCAHWEASIERSFTAIQYEDLVRDFEAKLRRVLARAGLSWSRNCLEYYKQDRAVMTFSAVQVRKPPSADHLDSTSAYADPLAGWNDGIEALGVDSSTGVWLDGRPAAARSEGGGAGGDRRPDAGGGLFGKLFGKKPRGEQGME